MSQGMIGYLLQSAIGDEMWLIGKFYTREEAQRIQREKGFVMGGGRAIIAELAQAVAALAGQAGTRIVPQ